MENYYENYFESVKAKNFFRQMWLKFEEFFCESCRVRTRMKIHISIGVSTHQSLKNSFFFETKDSKN